MSLCSGLQIEKMIQRSLMQQSSQVEVSQGEDGNNPDFI
jgi:hypothetical protein